MSDTASQQVIAEAAGPPRQATDSRGRVFGLRKLGALEKLRLFKACGEQSNNQPYLGYAMLAASVASVDGVPVPQPTNERQIEALVERLGDDGIAAVAERLQEDGATDSVEVAASAKN